MDFYGEKKKKYIHIEIFTLKSSVEFCLFYGPSCHVLFFFIIFSLINACVALNTVDNVFGHFVSSVSVVVFTFYCYKFRKGFFFLFFFLHAIVEK